MHNSFSVRVASVDGEFSVHSYSHSRRDSASSTSSGTAGHSAVKLTSPKRHNQAAHSLPTADHKLVFSTGPDFACCPRPPFLLVAAYHVHSLWAALLCLGGVLAGVYLNEGQRLHASTMGIVAAGILTIILYFFLLGIVTNRQFIGKVAEEVKATLSMGPEATAPLSPDRRVGFVQQEIRIWQDLTAGMLPSEPLFFLASAIGTWNGAKEGYIVLNSVGIILYCNDAVLNHFQYTRDELLSEDIATLIPAPYNRLHRAFMKKYDRSQANQKIVGGCRPLPVVDKAGKQSTVHLRVEEVFDPKDPNTSVFVGQMTFPEGPPLAEEIQRQMVHGTTVTAACQALHSTDSFVVINGIGTILYVSEGMPSLVGWKVEDMVGKNISMLMNPRLRGNHDQFLARYVAQVMEAGGSFPASTVVGEGRDLAVLRADGEYIRAWVSAFGLQAPSQRPQDCLFVGSLVYMQSAAQARHHRDAIKSPQRRSVYSNPSNSARYSHPGSVHKGDHRMSPRSTISPRGGLRATNLVRRKCTMMLCDVYGMQSMGGEQLSTEYQAFLSLLVNTCSKNGLQIHDPMGDRILVTSNILSSSGSQRSVVGMVMQQVLQGFHSVRSFGMVQVYAAACSTEAHCGHFGKQTILAGEGYDLCVCLLQLAVEARARCGFIDPSLYSELHFTYECRMANVVTLHPRQKRCITMPVYEVFALKEMSENEWMYQIEDEQRENRLAAWQECWALLQPATPGALPGQHFGAEATQKNAAALECLGRHLKDHEEDPLGLWLQRVLRSGDHTPATPQRAGKLLYLPHFSVPEPPMTAHNGRRPSKTGHRGI